MKLSSRHFTLIVILFTSVASAQVSTGTPPFGSFGGGPFDTINLGNLNVHFSIPVLHKAGRGVPFTYDLAYDSSIWYQATINNTTQWSPTANWGWTASSLAVLGFVKTHTTSSTQGLHCSGGAGGITTLTTTYAYVDSKGKSHPFPGSTKSYSYAGGCSGPAYGPPLTAQTTDGSGYTLTAQANYTGDTATTRSGILVYTNVGSSGGSGTYQDPNGNQLTVNNSAGEYFDTLSTTAVLTQTGSGTPASPVSYTYTAPSGGPASYTVYYLPYTVQTGFGVSGVSEYGPLSNALVSSIELPDGKSYSFTYETTPGSCTPIGGTQSTCVTGRIASVTLPTGGEVTYAYTGGSHGIYSDGSTAGLTRGLTATTTAPAQSWSYTRALVTGSAAPGSTWTTTVTDPSSNVTVLNFAEDGATTNGSTTVATYNFYETQRKVYQGSVSSNNCSSTNPNNCLLLTTTACYNTHYSSCSTSTVTSPITQTDRYAQPAGGLNRVSETLYNSYGLVTDDKEYNYGVALGAAPLSTYLVRETAISYASLSNGIANKPASVKVYDWSSGSAATIASTTYAYDGTAVTGTTGTPQHTSITGSRGNLTTLTTSTSSAASLSKTFTYYDTGNPNVAKDSNGTTMTYAYSQTAQGSTTKSCGNSFSTSMTVAGTQSQTINLANSMTWNCVGGVATQNTDPNNNSVSTNYTDSYFWRPANVYDQENNETKIYYYGETAVETALQNFNAGSSTSDFLTTVDGFGRTIFGQRLQAPGGNYDTGETDYNNLGQPYISRMPYSAAASPTSENTSAPATSTTYDALGRVLTVTDADGGNSDLHVHQQRRVAKNHRLANLSKAI